MKTKKISNKRENKGNKVKAIVIFLLALSVAVMLTIYAFTAGNIGYSMVLVLIAAILLVFFGIFAFRRYKDASLGLPYEDERSRRVMEKAAAKGFYVTLYVLLFIGMFSDDLLKFRDVSQATSAAVGIMALLWFGFWIYYNKKEI
jgi:uncharacterized membrane protein